MRKRTGDFVGHKGIPLKSDLLQKIQGHGIAITILSPGQPFYTRGIERNNHIFKSRQLVKRFDHLKRARYPQAHALIRRHARDVPAAVVDFSGGRPHKPGNQINHRGLSGPVGPNETEKLTLLEFEADIGKRLHAAEMFRKTGHLQKGIMVHFSTSTHLSN